MKHYPHIVSFGSVFPPIQWVSGTATEQGLPPSKIKTLLPPFCRSASTSGKHRRSQKKPDGTMALRFGEDTVNIKGTNLERLRIASANTGCGSFRKERTRSKR
jgi:hypothetical protein